MFLTASRAVAAIGAALLALAAPASATAQSAAPGDSLLQRLTAEALAENPALAARRAGAAAALARVRAAGALPDPTLDVGLMDLTLPRFAVHESDFTEFDVQLSQELPWPGTLGARTRAASSTARARQSDVAIRRRDVVTHTAELYYQLRYVVTARATLASQRALLATGVDIATTRYATTSAPESDPLQARVALARLDAEYADLAASETALRAGLRALRNIRGSDSVAVSPIDAAAVAAAHELEAAADSGGDAAGHPRLTMRRAEIEAADQQARVEQLAGRPEFTIMTRYGARPLGSDFFSAFVGVRLPLYAGRKQHRLADAARADADAARADLAEEEAALAEDVRTVRAQIASGDTRLQLLTQKVIPAAEATVDATLRNYRVGQVEFVTVLATEDTLYRARLDAARAAAEHLTHFVMLEQLLAPEDSR
jgi:outer membrane protein TolC